MSQLVYGGAIAKLRAGLGNGALLDLVRWASGLALIACALYIFATIVFTRDVQAALQQHPFYQVFLWDSQVFANAGEAMAEGRDPYHYPAVTVPYEQPFFSPPAVAAALGGLHAIFGSGLVVLLKIGHLIALIFTPLILSRIFIGRAPSETVWGYGLFAAGIGGYGVTTIVAGNLGALLYLAIFAAMARGLSTGKWWWFHAAVALAVQVKPPYGLLWIVPILVQGWSWRQVLQASVAASAAAAVYLVSYLVAPDMFREWLSTLVRYVEANRDIGYSVYGATRRVIGTNAVSVLPYILHIGLSGILLVFLFLDRTKGTMKAAALVAFAILANPRMKEYDVAFAVIPVAALAYAVLTLNGAGIGRRAAAVGAITLGMILWLKADQIPILGEYSYVLAVTAGILCLAILRPRSPASDPVGNAPVNSM